MLLGEGLLTAEESGFNWTSFVNKWGASEGWALNEKTGAVAAAGVLSPTRDGAYVSPGVTTSDGPAGTGYSDIRLFDSINSYVNNYSISLNSIFNGDVGSIICACKVQNAGVWLDGAPVLRLH